MDHAPVCWGAGLSATSSRTCPSSMAFTYTPEIRNIRVTCAVVLSGTLFFYHQAQLGPSKPVPLGIATGIPSLSTLESSAYPPQPQVSHVAGRNPST